MSDITIHLHFSGGPSRTQAEDADVGTETDQEKEYRLMRVYTDGGTLDPEEFDFLRRRGCVRY